MEQENYFYLAIGVLLLLACACVWFVLERRNKSLGSQLEDAELALFAERERAELLSLVADAERIIAHLRINGQHLGILDSFEGAGNVNYTVRFDEPVMVRGLDGPLAASGVTYVPAWDFSEDRSGGTPERALFLGVRRGIRLLVTDDLSRGTEVRPVRGAAMLAELASLLDSLYGEYDR